MFDMRFKHPSNILISGASGSGKTIIIGKILTDRRNLFTGGIKHVLLFYKEMQPVYKKFQDKGVFTVMQKEPPQHIEDLKTMLLRFPKSDNKLIIFDDMMHNVDDTFSELFTVIGHHYNASIIFTTQSLFFDRKNFRTMSLNAHYMFLCKSPRDSAQIIQLAKQMYPYDNSLLVQSYLDATKKAYSYLLLDLHQSTADSVRIRSSIFSQEKPMIVYLHKNNHASR